MRELIFISHANPEDNEFTLWLASRLMDMGYQVWSDVTQLFGAEIFWDDIEDAIRNHASKFVLLVSNDSQHKPGVLDEVAIAISVEREQKINRFVVPIRITDLPFSSLRANISRKNVIDFYGNWAGGLTSLKTVLERDNVPKSRFHSAVSHSKWVESILSKHTNVLYESSKAVSNWFNFSSFPERLNFFRVPIESKSVWSQFENADLPVYPYKDLVATFGNEETINSSLPFGYLATKAYQLSIESIFSGDTFEPLSLSWAESSNILSYLVRETWDRTMLRNKLLEYKMASGMKSWYFSRPDSSSDWTQYADVHGVLRKKKLTGFSKKRNVSWHFAMEAKPIIEREIKIALKPHVVFCEDSNKPIESSKRMHRLRRSFCRSWWNYRWRDLMLAYTTEIADANGAIQLNSSENSLMEVQSRPIFFDSPVSLSELNEVETAEDETDEELDRISDDESWLPDEGWEDEPEEE